MAGSTDTDLRHDTLRALRRTRQVREFTDEPISEDEAQAILEVARWTGSASNSQPWRLGVVRPGPTRDRIADLAPRARGVRTAPFTIAIVMPAETPTTEAYDEGRLAERILVAASALGLAAGIGWARDQARLDIAALFGFEPPAFVRTLVAVGHPTPEAAQPKAPPGTARLALSELVRDPIG